jgi:cytochrome P450
VRAQRLTVDLYSMNSNVVPPTFWYTLEALKDANLRERLLAEGNECRNPEDGSVDITKLCAQPLLQSGFAETLRLRVSVLSMRMSESEAVSLGKDYTVPKNVPIMMVSSMPAMNKDAWAAVRPGSVAKPLEEFWAERFLIDGGDHDSTDRTSDGALKTTGSRFSMDGVQSSWVPFGGGQFMCPGRHFAKVEIISTLTAFLNMYECEFSDPAGLHKVKPEPRRRLLGSLPPAGKVPVRIRRRIL